MKKFALTLARLKHLWAPIAIFIEDVNYFLREKRPSLLIGGGGVLAFLWLVFMIYFKLFSLSPFGSESKLGMGSTLLITTPLSLFLLWFIYWVGSGKSILGEDNIAYSACRFVYIAFKNMIIILVIVTLFIGAPRVKYYQIRAAEYSGFDNMSYYETRTLFNLFRSGSQIIGSTSEYNEEPSVNIGGIPSFTSSDSNSDSNSSTKKTSDIDGLAEVLCIIGAMLLMIAAILYFFILIVMAAIYSNFWLVTIICLAIGMIVLGAIDIHDGPNQ